MPCLSSGKRDVNVAIFASDVPRLLLRTRADPAKADQGGMFTDHARLVVSGRVRGPSRPVGSVSLSPEEWRYHAALRFREIGWAAYAKRYAAWPIRNRLPGV